MSRPRMPLYVADYLADTGHLGAAEHGAYLLLIMHYWANGGLPDDDRKLARIARMDASEWADARETIGQFFSDGWRHERIEKHLAEANAAYERRAEAGRKGGLSKAKAENEHCSSNASALPKQSEPEPDISSSLRSEDSTLRYPTPAPRKASRAKPRTALSEGQLPQPADVEAAKRAGLDKPAFIEQWQKFRDYHRAKGSLMADWSAAWRTWLGNMAQFQARSRAGPYPERRDPVIQAGLELMEEYRRAEIGADLADFDQDPRRIERVAGR